MDHLVTRPAKLQDASKLAEMCHCLWPEVSAAEHSRDYAPLLAGESPGSLPAVIFIAEEPDGRAVGFVEVGLRSHADGCDPSHPVGFIEGWYVAPEYRRKKVGTKLIAAAEQWARDQGSIEMASDAWLDALGSQSAHEALGYEVVDRCVHYRKHL
jgi:aminoglycoside 6'-N-acetyltransferase I